MWNGYSRNTVVSVRYTPSIYQTDWIKKQIIALPFLHYSLFPKPQSGSVLAQIGMWAESGDCINAP